MMVGEVRDLETAEITIRSALTGHLIFSTLHTNDAAGGITRLIDIGIEPYLIASSVEAFIAQRLVRLICPNCRDENLSYPADIKDELIHEFHSMGKKTADIKIYKGRGCEACNFTGYRGRTGIYEILLMDEKIRRLLLSKVSSDDIKKVAIESGMKILRQDGWDKVMRGLTTPEEVIRVTPSTDITLAELT
jgi:type II secretory ATPase GspE/PulE/Tfp pilus assembly ATPase PilB-like protein